MTYLTTLRRFNLNVRLFLISAAIIGFTNFGGIYAALFNLYLLRLGYRTQFIGTANAIGSFALVLTCLPASALERRFGSRNILLAGLLFNIISSVLLQAAVFIPETWRSEFILVSYALNSVGLALYLVNSQPFLAAATTSVERGHAFSIQAALWPLSGFVGSLFGGMIPGIITRLTGIPLTGPGPYQVTLWISSLLSVFAFLIMLPTSQPSPELPPDRNSNQELSGTQEPQSTSTLFFGKSPYKIIALLSIVVAVQITGEGSVRTFMNVYMDDALSLQTSMIGLILGLGQLVAGLAALLTPFFTARLGNALTYVLFSLAISLCMLPLVFMPSWYGAGLGFMGTIMMVQIARPALISIQMDSVPNTNRALMSAATTMSASLSVGLIGLLGGFMIPSYGYPAFFLIGTWMTALAAIGFWFSIMMMRKI